MPNPNQVRERVIKALEADPDSAPYLLRLPPEDKADLYAMLGRISHEICGSAKDDIIEHIDDRETVYMRTLKTAMDKLGEKFEESIEVAIETQGKINASHGRRITDLEHGQSYQEHQTSHTRALAENNVELTKQVKELVLVLTDRIDQGAKLSPVAPLTKKADAKKGKTAAFISSLPITHWVAILMFAAFIITMYTGHLGQLTDLIEAWRNSEAPMGGVK